MSNTFQLILGFTCLIPALTGLYKLKSGIDKSYLPFIIVMCVDLITEVCNYFVLPPNNLMMVDISWNIYVTINYCLLLYFFYKQQVIKQTVGWVLLLAGIAAMAVNCFLVIPPNPIIKTDTRYFFVLAAMGMSIIYFVLAVSLLNAQFFKLHIPVIKNPKAILAIGIVIFHVDLILVFSIMQLGFTDSYYLNKIFAIHQVANAITYLIFTWGLLCIPSTKKYLR